jgi:hypothetical protein
MDKGCFIYPVFVGFYSYLITKCLKATKLPHQMRQRVAPFNPNENNESDMNNMENELQSLSMDNAPPNISDEPLP